MSIRKATPDNCPVLYRFNVQFVFIFKLWLRSVLRNGLRRWVNDMGGETKITDAFLQIRVLIPRLVLTIQIEFHTREENPLFGLKWRTYSRHFLSSSVWTCFNFCKRSEMKPRRCPASRKFIISVKKPKLKLKGLNNCVSVNSTKYQFMPYSAGQGQVQYFSTEQSADLQCG